MYTTHYGGSNRIENNFAHASSAAIAHVKFQHDQTTEICVLGKSQSSSFSIKSRILRLLKLCHKLSILQGTSVDCLKQGYIQGYVALWRPVNILRKFRQ